MISSGKSCHTVLLPTAQQTVPASDTHQILAIVNGNRHPIWQRGSHACKISLDFSSSQQPSPSPSAPAIKSPCFNFLQWIQCKYSQIPNYWYYISLMPIAIHFCHYSAGRSVLFCRFGNNYLALQKGSCVLAHRPHVSPAPCWC